MTNLLIVDDDEVLLEAMADVLSVSGYRVRAVTSGKAALEALEAELPALIIADVAMSRMSGLQLLEAVRAHPGWDGVPFMFISAIDAPEIERQIATLGAEAFLRKPFDGITLQKAVAARLKRTEEIRLAESRRAYLNTIALLADLIEARDPYTGEHTDRVRRYAALLGKRLGWGERRLEILTLGALLHDVGKITVPDAILRKPGSLTEDERAIVQQHPVVGAGILVRVDYLAPAAPAVRGHHERWDGRGYPDGLAGEDTPVEARIIALADSFDAMTTDRPYRRAQTLDEALAEIRREAGRQFDPQLAKQFVEEISGRGSGIEDHSARRELAGPAGGPVLTEPEELEGGRDRAGDSPPVRG